MTFKDTAKRMASSAAIAGGVVMASTSGMLHDPAHPVQQALTAPDMKSAGYAALAAGITAGIVGRRKHFDDACANARHER